MKQNLNKTKSKKLLEKYFNDVKSVREKIKNNFAEPTFKESIAFAITEFSEAIDALLRENDKFTRNNNRNIDVEAEVADALFMLLTALPKGDVNYLGDTTPVDGLRFSENISGLDELVTLLRMTTLIYISEDDDEKHTNKLAHVMTIVMTFKSRYFNEDKFYALLNKLESKYGE